VVLHAAVDTWKRQGTSNYKNALSSQSGQTAAQRSTKYRRKAKDTLSYPALDLPEGSSGDTQAESRHRRHAAGTPAGRLQQKDIMRNNAKKIGGGTK